MARYRKALLTAALGLVIAAEAPRAEPVELELADLDRFTAGAWQSSSPFIELPTFDRRSYISSSYSMPIANAFAVCFMCSGDAAAVAIANAFGNARADAGSFASGFGQAFTRSDAVGPPFIFVLPDTFTAPDFGRRR
jgi:hypothetical protein